MVARRGGLAGSAGRSRRSSPAARAPCRVDAQRTSACAVLLDGPDRYGCASCHAAGRKDGAMTQPLTGQCLCGAVRFRLDPPFCEVTVCHCGMCRRWHGHVGAYTGVAKTALHFEDARGLAWFRSSDVARRGFCRECGSSLFWERHQAQSIGVAAGSLNPPTGLTTNLQIWVEDKGDYYPLDDDIPSRPK